LVKAGVENDTSVLQNDLSKRIAGYDTRIDSLMDYLTSREDYYYTMFTRMESALSQLESQSASLSGMFSGGA
jgi:flagellar hook-associated protein 2